MKKWKLGITSSILATLVLAGCGSNSDDNAGESSGDNKQYQVGITQIVEHPSLDAATEGFKTALKDEGLDVKFDEQNAQNDQNNSNTIAQNFKSKNVDLIFANSTPSAQASLNATRDIPIVFTSVTDPVAAKLITSFEEPGGNVTGTSDGNPEAIPSTIAFMAEEMGIKSVGTVYNTGEANSIAQVETMKKEAENAGLKLVEASVTTSSEVKQATESLVGKVDAIYIITDNTVVSALESVVMVANDKDIPLFVGEFDSVKRGGFAAFGFDYYDIGYDAGKMAAQILKEGKSPSEIPAQYPQNLKLTINEEAAKEMGIEIKDEWRENAEFIE